MEITEQSVPKGSKLIGPDTFDHLKIQPQLHYLCEDGRIAIVPNMWYNQPNAFRIEGCRVRIKTISGYIRELRNSPKTAETDTLIIKYSSNIVDEHEAITKISGGEEPWG